MNVLYIRSLSDRASSISPSTFGSEQRKILKAKSAFSPPAVKRNNPELIPGINLKLNWHCKIITINR